MTPLIPTKKAPLEIQSDVTRIAWPFAVLVSFVDRRICRCANVMLSELSDCEPFYVTGTIYLSKLYSPVGPASFEFSMIKGRSRHYISKIIDESKNNSPRG